MFAPNQMSSPSTVHVITGQPDQPVEAHLKDIARRHQVCYEVSPEWSIKDGHKVQIGFELELCGISSNEKCLHPVPGCPYCWRAYDEIRQIAESILPHEERPSRYDIQGFDRSLHVAPSKRHGRSEVVVRIVIMHRSQFDRPVDDCENRCLREMRERLCQLRIHEDYWRDDQTSQATNDQNSLKGLVS